ncbi:MAG: flagellar motor stator protein MotA [Gemmatimonadota bacterium]
MLVLIGLFVVVLSVIGGFMLAGGHVMALFHTSELIVICGTAFGTMLISTPSVVLKSLSAKMAGVVKGTVYTRVLYLDALKMMFELFQVARRDGLVAIEAHIESPEKSAVFTKYPTVLHQHHAVTFLCDSLRLVMVGSVPPYDLEALMDNEIDVHHAQEAEAVSALTKVSDSLPAIGIVAAVLGIVITMAALSGPVEEIGEKVGAALTGTFMGILLAYGFAAPLAGKIESENQSAGRFHQFIKASVVAFAKGFSPIVAVEFARCAVYESERPTFAEMETACKSVKAKPEGAK